MATEKLYICVDFDGTCTTHDYPRVGLDIGAIPVLKRLTDEGHKLIIFTMRSGATLDDATKWFLDNQIPLFGVNRNPTQVWTKSPKAYGHIYIDDAALGCPLTFDPKLSDRPFVNWSMVEMMLEQMGVLTIKNNEENV
jgi:hypothetical protein